MAEQQHQSTDEQSLKHRSEERSLQARHGREAGVAVEEGSLQARTLLRAPAASHARNSSARAGAIQSMQHAHGNRAVQRFMQSNTPLLEGSEGDHLARRIESLSGWGSKLEEAARERLEESLGADLSGVRVHTGSEADRLSRSMGAVAFTTGQDIFFTEGTYNPESSGGLRLLAHEVTHTVQQAAGPVDGTAAAGGVSLSDPLDSFEQEAERSAESVVSGEGARTSAGRVATQGAAASGHAPVQRLLDEIGDWWKGNKDTVGVVNDVVGGVTSTLGSLGDIANLGRFQHLGWFPKGISMGGYSGLANSLSKVDTLTDIGMGYGKVAGGTSKLGTAGNILGMALGAEKMITADSGFDVLEGGADSLFSGLGLINNPYTKSLSTGYSIGRLLDQGVGEGMDALAGTDFGRETLGLQSGTKDKYSISGMIGEGAFAIDKAVGSLLGDSSLAYNPETDDPTRVDRSYENTMAFQINQILDGQTNYTGEAFDTISDTAKSLGERASELMPDMPSLPSMPDFEMPSFSF